MHTEFRKYKCSHIFYQKLLYQSFIMNRLFNLYPTKANMTGFQKSYLISVNINILKYRQTIDLRKISCFQWKLYD